MYIYICLLGTYPQYAEFKLADNILHLIYNQGILWMACYFSPAFPIIHMLKIVTIFYMRNWSVLIGVTIGRITGFTPLVDR